MSCVSTALAAPALAIGASALVLLAVGLATVLGIFLTVQPSNTRPRDHALRMSRQPHCLLLVITRLLRWASLFSRLKPAPMRVAEVAISCIHSQVISRCAGMHTPASVYPG